MLRRMSSTEFAVVVADATVAPPSSPACFLANGSSPDASDVPTARGGSRCGRGSMFGRPSRRARTPRYFRFLAGPQARHQPLALLADLADAGGGPWTGPTCPGCGGSSRPSRPGRAAGPGSRAGDRQAARRLGPQPDGDDLGDAGGQLPAHGLLLGPAQLRPAPAGGPSSSLQVRTTTSGGASRVGFLAKNSSQASHELHLGRNVVAAGVDRQQHEVRPQAPRPAPRGGWSGRGRPPRRSERCSRGPRPTRPSWSRSARASSNPSASSRPRTTARSPSQARCRAATSADRPESRAPATAIDSFPGASSAHLPRTLLARELAVLVGADRQPAAVQLDQVDPQPVDVRVVEPPQQVLLHVLPGRLGHQLLRPSRARPVAG